MRTIPKSRDAVEEYYRLLSYILTRSDIEQLMREGYSYLLQHNVHYIFLSYLHHGTMKVINKCISLGTCLVDYNVEEVNRLLEGPLRVRNWCHVRYIYMAGFRDEILKNYIRSGEDLEPLILGYEGSEEIYEYMIRLHNIKYDNRYEYYYEVWYRIDPSYVEGYKLSCSIKNIRMLERLGLRDCDKYLKKPDLILDKFHEEWAIYLVGRNILEDECPYDYITWDDEPPYTFSLDANTLVQYFRYFKKYGINTTNRYKVEPISSVKSQVLDIIDNISYSSIIDHYISTGELFDYVPNTSDEYTSYHSELVPNLEVLERIVKLDYVKELYIIFPNITDDLAIYLKKNDIKVRIFTFPILDICILLEYDIMDLSNVENISIRGHNLYKLIMYPNGLAKLWDMNPSIGLLEVIIRYAPNALRLIERSLLIKRTYSSKYHDINIRTYQ